MVVTNNISIEEVKNKIIPLLKEYGVMRAALFGSLVRGEETNESDIDILVELPEKASLLDLAGLKIDLEELLKKEVDVITYDSIHPLLKDSILSEKVVVL